jgi:hypothetical protein
VTHILQKAFFKHALEPDCFFRNRRLRLDSLLHKENNLHEISAIRGNYKTGGTI